MKTWRKTQQALLKATIKKSNKANEKSLSETGFFHGAEGEIRTLAPVNPVYSLSRGAPYSHLGTSAKLFKMAEMVGFEPTDTRMSTVFKTASLNRSDTSPYSGGLPPHRGKQYSKFAGSCQRLKIGLY